ncbi:MAG: exo-alpha-sialidase [Planctomycetaceae bacterium]|jgi:predicted neuraminidase|nr:exo-alpha-sialidase [Planctomycetaceae bacterium]
MRPFLTFTLAFTLFSPLSAQEKNFSPLTTPDHPALITQEFVYTDAPFPQCHASTITSTKTGLLAAWFGGTHEKNDDVEIWTSHFDGKSWSPVRSVANGIQSKDFRYPCWNPVLFTQPDGEILLFYKVGADPRTWWGELITSVDNGKTWTNPVKLPEGIVGPIKNKPELLGDGRLLCPTSTEDNGWRVHMEWLDGIGKWDKTAPLNDGEKLAAIQPAILKWGDRLQIVCRTRQKQISSTWSDDLGKTWSEMTLLKDLPNPNSGIDAVSLKDGRGILIYNNTPRGRSPLNVAISTDGNSWKDVLILEDQPGEYSYPAVIQTADGKIHITYTWKRRRVKHVVLDATKI